MRLGNVCIILGVALVIGGMFGCYDKEPYPEPEPIVIEWPPAPTFADTLMLAKAMADDPTVESSCSTLEALLVLMRTGNIIQYKWTHSEYNGPVRYRVYTEYTVPDSSLWFLTVDKDSVIHTVQGMGINDILGPYSEPSDTLFTGGN